MGVAYKYCGLQGVAILENLELKVTPPNQFNDPFEFTPRMICTDPIRRAREVLRSKKHLPELYKRFIEKGLFKGSFQTFRIYVKTHRDRMAEELIELPQCGSQSGAEATAVQTLPATALHSPTARSVWTAARSPPLFPTGFPDRSP